MVTLSLQNMRGNVPGWEEWYSIKQDEMRSYPLMKYMLDLRNRIEKQTSVELSIVAGWVEINDENLRKLEPRPPGTVGFIGGSAEHGGASGWIVRLSDGEEEFFAVDLPKEMGEIFANMTDDDLPEDWRGRSAVEMIEKYLGYLASLLRDAEKKFL